MTKEWFILQLKRNAHHQAVKNLNGKIDLESEMGKGSKFIFELPLS